MSIDLVMPSNHRILCCPLLLLPSRLNQGLFQWVGSLHQVAKVLAIQLQASVLPMNIQGCFPLGFTGLISSQSQGLSRVFSSTTISGNSQEFSPAPQSKSINFLVLIPYGSTLTSLHDYWRNPISDSMDLCWHSDVSAFPICCLGLSWLSFQGASIFEFHGCSHCPQWIWSPNLSLFPLFPHLNLDGPKIDHKRLTSKHFIWEVNTGSNAKKRKWERKGGRCRLTSTWLLWAAEAHSHQHPLRDCAEHSPWVAKAGVCPYP